LRLAILSDIHGNLTALKAVLLDLEERGGVDRTVCLGDVATNGPQPREVIEFLRGSEWPCVRGNMDEMLANRATEELGTEVPREERRRIQRLDTWTGEQLSDSDRAYLATLKPRIASHPGDSPSFLLYHGSPRSNTEGIYSTMPDDELRTRLKGRRAAVFAGGHTHAQMLRRLDGSAVINPGSVGFPFQRTPTGRILHPSRAEYAIVSSLNYAVDVELLSAPYPLADLRRVVRDTAMPDPDRWISDWF
jgi:predicted phosphodiesterase